MTRRKAWILGLLTIAALAPVGAATAADPTSNGTGLMGGTTDSHGLTIDQYQPSFSTSSGLNLTKGAGKEAAYELLKLAFVLYAWFIKIGLWLLDQARTWQFMDLLKPPFEILAGTINDLIRSTGIIGLVAVCSVVISGLVLVAGRFASGFTEIVTTTILAGLLTGLLINPVAALSGPNGAISQAQKLGSELSDSIANPQHAAPTTDPSTPQPKTTDLNQLVIETFIRKPLSQVNWGDSLDESDPKCAKVWDDALKAASKDDDAVQKKVIACNTKYEKPSTNPTSGLGTFTMLGLFGGFLPLMAGILILALLIATCLVLYEATMLMIRGVQGLLPGAGRAAIGSCVTGMAFGLLGIVGALVAFSALIRVSNGVLTNTTTSMPFIGKYVLLNLIMLVGTLLIAAKVMGLHRKARTAGQQIASKLSSKPTGPGPVSPMSAAAPYLATAASLGRRGAMPTAAGVGAGVGAAAAATHSRAHQVARIAGKTTAATAKLAFASTVGAPVYGPRAVVAAKAKTLAAKKRLATSVTHAKTAANRRAVQPAKSFSAEYRHNLAAAARVATKVTHTDKPLRKAGVAAATATGPYRNPKPTPRRTITGIHTDAPHHPGTRRKLPATQLPAVPVPDPATTHLQPSSAKEANSTPPAPTPPAPAKHNTSYPSQTKPTPTPARRPASSSTRTVTLPPAAPQPKPVSSAEVRKTHMRHQLAAAHTSRPAPRPTQAQPAAQGSR